MENPHVVHETLLHTAEIVMWCATTHWRIAEPIILQTLQTLNAALRVQEFLGPLTEEEKAKARFQQGVTTRHTSLVYMAKLSRSCGDCIMLEGLLHNVGRTTPLTFTRFVPIQLFHVGLCQR
jgi:hypothetical protein